MSVLRRGYRDGRFSLTSSLPSGGGGPALTLGASAWRQAEDETGVVLEERGTEGGGERSTSPIGDGEGLSSSPKAMDGGGGFLVSHRDLYGEVCRYYT